MKRTRRDQEDIMSASKASSIEIGGQEYRVLETLTNLPAMRTWLCEASAGRMHLRVMTGGCAADVVERARKIREAGSGSGLVVPVETGEHDGQIYALRAWVDAEPFDAFAKRFKFAPKRQEHALNVGVKLCRAVEGLHHAGLVHGALKNSNVFFEKDGSPVITDPVLMPEATKKAVPREDVRALGLLLCRLYTGKPELVINDYTLMMLARARVPKQLLRVLWQAIHEDAGMRFQDAATLGRALREVPLPEYQRTVQVRALPDNVGPSDGMPTWLRNTAILVGLVGLIAVASWFLGKGEAPNAPASAQAVANSSTPQAGADFWELPVPGSQPIRMRRLPAFEAMLGDDAEPNSSRRMVRVDQPFSIATTEVTRAQFSAFVAATGYRTTAETAGGDPNRQVWVVESDRIRPRPDYNWRQPGFTQGDDHPVTSISWHDAKAFCDWLSQQTGQRVRLPSEHEWEYAARAGSTARYWWGDDPAGAQGKENVMDQSVKSIFPSRNTAPWDDGFAHTSPVGSFEANPVGLHDMFGNVWEWTADDWNGNASAKTFRGAGFDSWPPKSAAYRFGNAATMGSNLRGFRIVV
jgi:formylglycine-generating enzyme required for sulfatase activity